jgi:lipid-A-disaccharide synthase
VLTFARQAPGRPLSVFVIATEESGDRLGGGLLRALRERCDVTFAGIGGGDMAAAGAPSLFPIEPLSIMGFAAVPRLLPLFLRRIREATAAVIAARPDVLVIVDSPSFTHRVARRVRRAAPDIPIIDYVSPQVWAWRSGRARAMRSFVDHVLAILPFEPAVHARLGGPPCTYVGHPLAERVADLRPNEAEKHRRSADPPLLLVLPGSRQGEIKRLLDPFAAAVELLLRQIGRCELVLPTFPHLADAISRQTASWPTRPRIVCDPAAKYAAFRQARAALAASGTVTLELALAGVPTVAAYRVTPWEAAIARRVVKTPSVILANLVLGENVVPELLQEDCVPAALADALVRLIHDTPERRRQLEAFARLDGLMQIGAGSASGRAADIVLRSAGWSAENSPSS